MKKNKLEFYSIYDEIYQVNKFRELKNDLHHGLSRLDHTARVAKMSFVLSKTLKLDYKSTTRGALLHDFFTDKDVEDVSSIKCLNEHPKVALNNALEYFEINEVEKDIISKHMFPIGTLKLPTYKESVVVSISDKIAGIYEFFRYKLNMGANFAIILLINILR